jgi:hypothetical protein
LANALGIRLAEGIPGCRTFLPPDEGDFPLAIARTGRILSTLLMK